MTRVPHFFKFSNYFFYDTKFTFHFDFGAFVRLVLYNLVSCCILRMNDDKWTSVPEENYLEVTIHDKLVQSAQHYYNYPAQQLGRSLDEDQNIRY